MKKLFAIFLCFAILLSVTVSCSKKKNAKDSVSFTYLYNDSDAHRAVGEYLQSALAQVGIKLNLETQEWNTFINTRKDGDYTIARNGWVADYNDPICFLDMWTSTSGNNDVQFGKGAHASLKMYDLDLTPFGYDIKVENGTWTETYDRLISTIKSCEDREIRYKMMHIAEDMLMDTGCIVPLYYYTDLYMLSSSVEGFYANPLGCKFFMNSKIKGQDYINVCIASEPDTLDPTLNSTADGATMLAHLFSGLAKWGKGADGKLKVVPDLAVSLPEGVKNEDGSVTYTYTLRDGLKWSNGDALTAKDFEESWKRAASSVLGADYGYLLGVIKGYGTDKLAVRALNSKTLEVTLESYVPYWNELLAFPTYYPVHASARESGKWATSPSTYICNGAYTMESWEHNSKIVLKKNPNYHSSNTVTMNKINFFLSGDTNTMLVNFKNGGWQFIDRVPTNEIKDLKSNPAYKDQFYVVGQVGTYFVCFNINEDLLPESSTLKGAERERAQAEIRRAISLLIDRNYIVESVAQGGQIPAPSFVAMGMTDADGGEFYKNAGSATDGFDGYYDVSPEAFEGNFKSAVETLKKYYDFVE